MLDDAKTVAYTCRVGEGFQVGSDWTLRVSHFRPYPLATVTRPAGEEKEALFPGARFPLGPALVIVTAVTINGRRRCRFLIRVPKATCVAMLPSLSPETRHGRAAAAALRCEAPD